MASLRQAGKYVLSVYKANGLDSRLSFEGNTFQISTILSVSSDVGRPTWWHQTFTLADVYYNDQKKPVPSVLVNSNCSRPRPYFDSFGSPRPGMFKFLSRFGQDLHEVKEELQSCLATRSVRAVLTTKLSACTTASFASSSALIPSSNPPPNLFKGIHVHHQRIQAPRFPETTHHHRRLPRPGRRQSPGHR